MTITICSYDSNSGTLPLFSLQYGQGDVVLHRQETNDHDEQERGNGRQRHADVQTNHDPIEHSATDGSHGVNLLAEDNGYLIEQYVAQHSTCGTRDAAHNDGHPDGMPIVESLLQSGNGEQGEAQGVERKPRVVEAFQRSCEHDDDKLGHERAKNVHGRRHPERCGVEHDIAQRTAANSYRNAAYKATEPVVVPGSGMADARYGEGQCSQDFNDLEDGINHLRVCVDHLLMEEGIYEYLNGLP